MRFKADLHIHTCLSPCGELEMIPPLIIKQAKACGLEIIGICDHNSCENVSATAEAAVGSGIVVIGGMEITTREEVHVLAISNDMDALKKIQKIVYRSLDGKNDPEKFGEQIVADKNGDPKGINERLLIGATRLSLEETIKTIHKYNALAIAAHIDREGFGIIGQIGFIPEGLPLDGIEVSSPDFKPYTEKYVTICSSDAHFLNEIGKRYSYFYIEEATFEEIKMAFRREGGRKIEIKIPPFSA